MILLLDNYDSFTYNLAQYLGELGCQVEVHRNDKISVEEIAKRKPEKIVISPGPCTPQQAGIRVAHPRGTGSDSGNGNNDPLLLAQVVETLARGNG